MNVLNCFLFGFLFANYGFISVLHGAFYFLFKTFNKIFQTPVMPIHESYIL